MSEKMKPSELLTQPGFTEAFKKFASRDFKNDRDLVLAAVKEDRKPLFPEELKNDKDLILAAVKEDSTKKSKKNLFNLPSMDLKNFLNPDPNGIVENNKKEKEKKELEEKDKKFISLNKMKIATVAGIVCLIPGLPLISTTVAIVGGVWGINKLMENKAAMDTFNSWKSTLTEKIGNTDIGKGLKDGSLMESVKNLEVPESVKSTLDAGIKNIKDGKPLEVGGAGLQNVGKFLADKASKMQQTQEVASMESTDPYKGPRLPKPPTR